MKTRRTPAIIYIFSMLVWLPHVTILKLNDAGHGKCWLWGKGPDTQVAITYTRSKGPVSQRMPRRLSLEEEWPETYLGEDLELRD